MSQELKAARKKRGAAKGWVTRSLKELQDLFEDASTSFELLDAAASVFDQRLATFDALQAEVELLLEEYEDLEADMDETDKFLRDARKTRAHAAKLLKKASDADDQKSTISSKERSEVKLPRLELPKYSGELTEWQSFWDRFEALVEQSDLPCISKFSYLQSSLTGEAHSVIQGLSLSSTNYKVACDLLKERFGRPERIIFAHVQGLLNVSMPTRAKGASQCESLWKLQDQLLGHVRSLEGLGIDGDKYGVVLTPIILSRLPQDIRLEWSRDSSGHEGDLEWLLKFLQQEIKRRERSETFKDVSTPSTEKGLARQEVERKKVSSASALQTSAELVPTNCVFCQKRHKSEKCWLMLKLDLPAREEKVKEKRLCFKCLLPGHNSKDCKGKVKCTRCNGFHNVLFCRGFKPSHRDTNLPNKEIVTNPSSDSVSTQSSNVASSENVGHVGISHVQKVKSTVLQTAKVKVLTHGGNSVNATVMFDLGADTTYVSHDFVRRIKPKWVTSKYTSYSVFGNKKSQGSKERNVYDMNLLDVEGHNHSVFAVEVMSICPPLRRQRVPADILQSFSDLPLADDYGHDRDLTLDILVGVDNYWRFVSAEGVMRSEELVAHKSVFGWILSGSCRKANEEIVSHQMLCINTVSHVSDSDLHNFWKLESVGIYTDKDTPTKSPLLETFEDTVQYVDGRYEVALPWKSEEAKLSLFANENVARKRLSVLNYKFEKNPDLKEAYDQVFKSYEENGIIVEVPPSEMESPYPTYYLPHRPIIKDCVSTKIRPVFDASAAGPNGISLNDCLESGPSLIPDLVEILLRFRRWNVALTADITKAFLQIGVQRADQDVHRFLWQCSNRVRVMRFVRVPFGNTSSPFLLNATLQHHLNTYPDSVTVRELKENLYVDDWLSGACTVEEASKMLSEARTIFSEAGMTLSKWHSNSDFLINQHYKYFDSENEVIKLLGMSWNSSEDVFSFKGLSLDDKFDFIFTKRNVLSLIARIFDPLGLISPFTMYAKILFQEIWHLGLGWDETLPHDLQHKFQCWCDGIKTIKNLEVDRCYFPMLVLKSFEGLEVHVFSDASEKGYGSCVYLRMPKSQEEFHVSFVMSRTKVAPIKRVTLPRLELLGALLSARLSCFVKNALHLPNSVKVACWTDSKVALSWIKGDPSKWKMFVANRVTEIQTLTSPSDWHHCPSTDNPADLMTRGVLADKLIDHDMWLRGPSWLFNSSCLSTGVSVDDEKHDLVLPIKENEEEVVMTVNEETSSVFDFSRYSDFTKCMNITAWVRRFIHNCKSNNSKHSGPLTYEELSQAKDSIVLCVQRESYEKEMKLLSQRKPLPNSSSLRKLDPFVDSNGLLRIKGRLQNSDLSYDSKHPIIIPNCHVAKLIVQFQHKILKHAGVQTLMSTIRNSFWIIGLRQVAKRVCKECVACKRFDSRPCSQSPPPLPGLRVKSTFPFAITGLDYAGPLFAVDQPSKKLYILLFTCAVTRSVHLELTDSLSVPDCMLAIRRFSARRGLPSVIYSDNAKTFVSVAKLLHQYFSILSPEWKFIAPRAPWWGGWWERLVRSVKSALKKSLGSRCLTRSELETTLCEVEACINSRPLTYVNEDNDVSEPLTPSHFLIGRVAGFQPHVSDEHVNISSKDLSEREIVRKRQLDQFWKVWSTDYLRNLPPTVKGFKPSSNVKKGSVVLLREDNVPRMNWPLGIITDLLPGSDGIVRCVNVKTAKGVFCRPVQKLHDLEIFYDVNNVTGDSEVPNEILTQDEEIIEKDESEDLVQGKTTRSGRVVRPRTLLDL